MTRSSEQSVGYNTGPASRSASKLLEAGTDNNMPNSSCPSAFWTKHWRELCLFNPPTHAKGKVQQSCTLEGAARQGLVSCASQAPASRVSGRCDGRVSVRRSQVGSVKARRSPAIGRGDEPCAPRRVQAGGPPPVNRVWGGLGLPSAVRTARAQRTLEGNGIHAFSSISSDTLNIILRTRLWKPIGGLGWLRLVGKSPSA